MNINFNNKNVLNLPSNDMLQISHQTKHIVKTNKNTFLYHYIWVGVHHASFFIVKVNHAGGYEKRKYVMFELTLTF